MSQKYIAPRGTQDVYGVEARKWQKLEKIAREICDRYHIQEMRTPMYEHTEVFKRENDASDVVNKEMYTFVIKNRDGESPSLTLRPEGTAGVARAFVQHKLYATGGSFQKYFYIAPNFRYERPQKGRMRIHHQFGVELIGPISPMIDVEAISVGLSFLHEVGLKKFKLLVNTIGDAKVRKIIKLRYVNISNRIFRQCVVIATVVTNKIHSVCLIVKLITITSQFKKSPNKLRLFKRDIT
ncbi:ATP phosphoribosyltransferase regulatory subunit [Erysipelothrix sp. D19-032]